MTNHGFGGGRLQSSRSSIATKIKIAKCISDVPGVTWAHVVHKGFHYNSRDKEKAKMIGDNEVESRYDLIFEMERKCDLHEIAKCAWEFGHDISIDVITVKDQSYKHRKPGKHP